MQATGDLSAEEANVFNVLLQTVSTSIITHQKEDGNVSMTPLHGSSVGDGDASSSAQRQLDAAFAAAEN
eukprot:8575973-Karenia_brevis.AAC.1